MKIYLIPGLAYDDRIFARLKFRNQLVKYLTWIDPCPNEPLRTYAKRMFGAGLDDPDDIVIIGHSFGGMIAQEIAMLRKVKKIILISSITSRMELPSYFKLIAPLKLYPFFGKNISIKTVKYWGKRHDFKNSNEQEFFISMVNKQSNSYLQWALKSLSNWKSPGLPKTTSIYQLHGTDDRTFPIKLIDKPDAIIKGGSHMMVYNRSEEINKLILIQLKVS